MNTQTIVHQNHKKKRESGIFIAVPTTGIVRYEWHMAFQALVTPTNWSSVSMSRGISAAQGYTVAQARNLLIRDFLQSNRDWLLFIDHDVLVTPNLHIWVRSHVENPISPVIGGLYYVKGTPAEPLIYRGNGDGAYKKFVLGEKVWCSGLGMGCTLLEREFVETLWRASPVIKLPDGSMARKVFHTPQTAWIDPETQKWMVLSGTEDLYMLGNAIKLDIFKKIPKWKHLSGKKYPYIVDTNLFLRHININGMQYPLEEDFPAGYVEWRKAQQKVWDGGA